MSEVGQVFWIIKPAGQPILLAHDKMVFLCPQEKRKCYVLFGLSNPQRIDQEIGNHLVTDLFPTIEKVTPSPFLLHSLEIAKSLPSTFSEKSRSENLITPILFDVYEHSQQSITIFSGCALNINEQLSGICDYIIAGKNQLLALDSPIVCIVEAKNRSIEEGLAQAGAEMVAAQLFNQQEQNDIPSIYGVVTNGIEWKFLKLTEAVLTNGSDRFHQASTPKLQSTA